MFLKKPSLGNCLSYEKKIFPISGYAILQQEGGLSKNSNVFFFFKSDYTKDGRSARENLTRCLLKAI